MFMGLAASEHYIVPQEAMLMFMGLAASGHHIGPYGPCCSRGHVNVCVLCCPQGLGLYPWPMPW